MLRSDDFTIILRANILTHALHTKIGTAAAAFMAIRVLLDHGVREDRIVFVTFVVARGGGVSVLRRAFPDVTIVCSAIDDEMQEGWLEGFRSEHNPEGVGRKVWVMQPGMGQIGMLFTYIVCRGMPLNNYRGSLLSMTDFYFFSGLLLGGLLVKLFDAHITKNCQIYIRSEIYRFLWRDMS
jgi:hypothetical protein